MRRPFTSTLVAAMFVACAATFARASAEDDIKASGKAFVEALLKGDAAVARKHAITTEEGGKMVDAMASMMHGRKELVDAAVAKFGDSGKEILPGAMFARTPDWEVQLKDAKVDVTGDTATVTTEKNPNHPTKFKKDGGLWKVDLTEQFKQSEQARNAGSGAAGLEKFGKVMSETAGEIKDGKYASVQEARTAMFQKMGAAFGGGRGPRPQPGGGNQ